MAVVNKSAHALRGRRFSVEPLEDRALLSGFALPSQPDAEAISPLADVRIANPVAAPSSNESVQIVEISPAEEDEPDDDSAREIAVAELPRQVVAAVRARFPGASLVAAEMNEDVSLFFDVSAVWGGVELVLTLSPDGELIEVEQPLASAELPESVLNWLARSFPDSSILEAELVTANDSVSYDLLFATPGGQAFDAVLRVPGGGTPGVDALPGAIGEPLLFVSELLDDRGARRFADAPRDGDSARAAEREFLTLATVTLSPAVQVSGPAAAETGPPAAQRDAVAVAAESGRESQVEPLTDPVQVTTRADSAGISDTNNPFLRSATLPPVIAAIGSAIPATWLPQLAQALIDVFPLDTSALERSLQQFLDEVDSLTGKLASVGTANQLTPRLLIAAATLAGAERLITQINKTRQDPVLTSAGRKSTWTWVLNLGSKE